MGSIVQPPNTFFFLSPPPPFSGSFQDPKSQRHQVAQVAFQVWVRPGSYKPGPPSVSAPEALDPRFGPTDIEWVTKEKGATVLCGLLVHVE